MVVVHLTVLKDLKGYLTVCRGTWRCSLFSGHWTCVNSNCNWRYTTQQQEAAEVAELRRFTTWSREQRSRPETDEAGGDSFERLIEAEMRPYGRK